MDPKCFLGAVAAMSVDNTPLIFARYPTYSRDF